MGWMDEGGWGGRRLGWWIEFVVCIYVCRLVLFVVWVCWMDGEGKKVYKIE